MHKLKRPVMFDHFNFNESLLYAIKTISGDSENEVFSYFYNIGDKLFKDCISRTKLPKSCNRKVEIFYKDTNILVRFDVWSTYFNSTFYSDDKIHLFMSVNYPNNMRKISGSHIENMITETGLGLSDEQVLSLQKPSEEKYKCLR